MLRALSVAVFGVVLLPREAGVEPGLVHVGDEVVAQARVEGACAGRVRGGGGLGEVLRVRY